MNERRDTWTLLMNTHSKPWKKLSEKNTHTVHFSSQSSRSEKKMQQEIRRSLKHLKKTITHHAEFEGCISRRRRGMINHAEAKMRRQECFFFYEVRDDRVLTSCLTWSLSILPFLSLQRREMLKHLMSLFVILSFSVSFDSRVWSLEDKQFHSWWRKLTLDTKESTGDVLYLCYTAYTYYLKMIAYSFCKKTSVKLAKHAWNMKYFAQLCVLKILSSDYKITRLAASHNEMRQ